jgi:hypothetical protein
MRSVSLLLLLAMLLLAAPANDQAAPSALAWLGFVDSGKYADSWTEASSYFRMRVPQEQWVGMVRGVRGPLGALVSRKPPSIKFAKTLPGAPDGNYAVLTFQTSFQNKASAVETLTLMADGEKWRAAGYFIK